MIGIAGWIKLHRCLFEKAIWTTSTPEQKTILITLLGMANHTEKEWEWKGERYKAKPGQFVTSLKSIAEKCGDGVSIRNVRTALERFEKYEFLTNESTNRNRLVTITNWGFYQSKEEEPTKQLTSNRQATDKQLTTNKNDKNNKDIYCAFFEDIWGAYPNKKGKGKVSDTRKKMLHKLGDEIKRCIERYISDVEERRKEFPELKYQNGSTFFNSGYVDYLDANYEEPVKRVSKTRTAEIPEGWK